MKLSGSRGSIAIIVEVGFVVAIIIAFLFAAKFFNQRQDVNETYYPNQPISNKVTITGSPSAPPKGVSVGAAGASAFSSSSPRLNSAPSVSIVTYTKTGFSPATVRLSAAERTILFVNKSSGLLWPIGAPLDQPTFSSGYGLAPGESFTVTLPAGSRRNYFYNHFNEAHRGLLIAE